MQSDKAKIAIIDDDEDIVEVTKALLKRRGFDVVTALDGESGITLVREAKPDLVLLDLMLPGIDGYEVCRRIKEDNNLWHIPIIFFTAKGEFSEKITGLKSGADDYVTKPFESEELLARIWMILKRTYNILDANPLSKLPGNNAIQKQIDYRLTKTDKFAIAHLDVDRFKSFNDEYGFERGDQALLKLSEILVQVVREKGETTDFIGHIGGDDFVLISEPSRIDVLCKEIIRRFDELVPQLYNQEHREKGYIIIKNRQGVVQEFPLMSLSIAVVTNEKRKITHIGEINAIATELKKYAKSLPGSNFVKDRREHEPSPQMSSLYGQLEQIAQILQEKKINLFFQPIMNVENHSIQGYETSVRAIIPSKILSQEDLFNQTIELKMEEVFSKIYFEKLRVFSYGIPKGLWILAWIHPKIFLTFLENQANPIHQIGLDPSSLIYQIKAGDLMRYDVHLKEIFTKIKKEGFRISIAMTWGIPIPLSLLLEMKPHFLYLDSSYISEIKTNLNKQTLLKMLSDVSKNLQSQLIVSDITTQEEIETVKEYGISLMSGKIFFRE